MARGSRNAVEVLQGTLDLIILRASYVPVRRALAIDPSRALRTE